MRIQLALILSLFCCAAAMAAAPASKPNILVILVDDMGWSDIECYGSEVPTPNLNRLASEGVRFTQFYNTARCSPTRASLITGHYPHEAGMGWLDGLSDPTKPGYLGRLADTSVTIAEVLKPAGYYTSMVGKWHMGQPHGTPPWERGFNRSMNSPAGGIYFPQQGGGKKLFLDGKEKDLTDPIFGKDWYSSHLFADWTLKFIDDAKAHKQPFFNYLAFCAPHFPLMAPKETIDKYRGKYMIGWDKLREERHGRQVELGLVNKNWPLSPRPPEVPAWDSVSEKEKERFDTIMSIYAAMIEEMDKSVGMVIEGLRSRGELDNTLVLFLSDNGGNAESGPNGRLEGKNFGGPQSTVFLGQNWATLANTPYRRYKHYVHEGGISTPLIAHWPAGIPASRNGKLEPQPGHLVDIMATAVAVSGATYPKEFKGHTINPMEGVSLVPAFSGQSVERKNPIFWEHEGNRAVRDGKWKIVALNNKPWELYDIEADRTEQNDLSAQHPDVVKRLTEAYDAFAKRTHVLPWPVKSAADEAADKAKGKGKKAKKKKEADE